MNCTTFHFWKVVVYFYLNKIKQMKKLIKEHIEMVKVLKEAPRKEIIQGAIFLASITALFYYSILIFG